MKKIVCLGDSITDCDHLFSASPLGNGYVSLLEKKLNHLTSKEAFLLTNRGQDGFTVFRVLERLEGWISSPLDLITLLIGVNDLSVMMTTNRTKEQQQELMQLFFSHYEAILRICSQKNIPLILMEPFLFSWPMEYRTWLPLQKEMSNGIALLAQKYHCSYIPLQEELQEEALKYGYDFLTTDGIHLTQEGHNILSEKLFSKICDFFE